jgi:hypothetical protein
MGKPMVKVDVKRWRERLSLGGYKSTRWLVMTVAALASFLGFQLADAFFLTLDARIG